MQLFLLHKVKHHEIVEFKKIFHSVTDVGGTRIYFVEIQKEKATCGNIFSVEHIGGAVKHSSPFDTEKIFGMKF